MHPDMSIYASAALDGNDESIQHAHKLIDHVEAIVARAPEKYAIATLPNDVEKRFEEGC